AGIVREVGLRTSAVLGMHAHNDSGCAVANSMAAVAAGARHVQGCVNGYGERTGNADIIAVAANLELKKGAFALKGNGLPEATRIAHAISEITNIAPFARQPYVGASAFAHKAGLHASAIKVDPDLYQHTQPENVGNDMRMLVSEMAGRASIELKGRELGFDLAGQSELLGRVTDRVKNAEAAGYTYDAADASFELLLRSELGEAPTYWDVESWRVRVSSTHGNPRDADAEAVIKLHAGGGERVTTVGEGNGPVNALDHALRTSLSSVYPEIARFELVDLKVRIMDASHGTDAVTRVLITTVDSETGLSWRTVGVGPNVIEASWEALTDALLYGLLKLGVTPNP
ncbi:MAG: alpha-isopropylmalate synthase regulatory domain-containing protein, partial [Actinomycetota bacterium]